MPIERPFWLVGLKHRQRRPEIMDQPGLDPGEHACALRGLRRINRLSRARAALWGRIAALEPGRPGTPLRVLDVACGGGDTVVALGRRALRAGRCVRFEGCDISPVAVACAEDAAARSGVAARFFTHDAVCDPLPEGYDVVTCSLFLHHLDEENAVRLMRRMAAAARQLVLIDDVLRSRTGYVLAWAGCRLLSRSPVVHYDGPVSVAAAFRGDEAYALASRAGLRDVSITAHWPQRYLLAGRPR